jgi:hypothetical protein
MVRQSFCTLHPAKPTPIVGKSSHASQADILTYFLTDVDT